MRIEGQGMKVSTKTPRSDKKTRVCPYVDQPTFTKLKRLSKACDLSPAQLTLEMIHLFVNHPDYISWIQSKHHVPADDPFRITPVVENGKVMY
jgi:hypothetical protein